MAYEGLQVRLTGIESGALALSASQFKLVQLDTAGRAILAATAGQKGVIGVIQDEPAATGDPCFVAAAGITKVIAGCPLTAGSALVSDASARAISAAATASHYILGRALETAAAAGNIISMIFQHEGPNSNDL